MTISTKNTRHVFNIGRVKVRAIAADEELEWNRLMEYRHPLGNAQFAGHRIKYVAEHCGRAVALACFSACAYHLADRDRWVGWTSEQATKRRHFVVQNSRLLILPGEAENQRNLASRVLSLCAKRLAADWPDRFEYPVLLLETFVDPAQFKGTCYKASGWTDVGSTRGFRRDGREFYCADSTPKRIWVRPLRQDAREVLRAAELPEPLRRFEKELPPKCVAARLGIDGLRSLFMVLQDLHDPRRDQGKRYPLGCCLSLITCALLAGCKGMRECAEFAATLTQSQLRALRSWRNPRSGKYVAASFVTLWRTASGVDAEQLERTVNQWFRDEGRFPEAIAIDGKVLRATLQNEDGGSCAVSAVSHEGSPLFSIRLSPNPRARKSLRPKS